MRRDWGARKNMLRWGRLAVNGDGFFRWMLFRGFRACFAQWFQVWILTFPSLNCFGKCFLMRIYTVNKSCMIKLLQNYILHYQMSFLVYTSNSHIPAKRTQTQTKLGHTSPDPRADKTLVHSYSFLRRGVHVQSMGTILLTFREFLRESPD